MAAPAGGGLSTDARPPARAAAHDGGNGPGRRAGPGRALGLAALSAGLYTAAQPPWNGWPLVWVALVPLCIALPRLRPAAAAAIGGAFGLAIGLGVGVWLPGAIEPFFDIGPSAAWSAVGLYLAATVALPWALAAAALAAIARAGRGSPFAVAAVVVATELVRARLFVGNPWGLLAHALPPGSTWLQTADLLGASGPALAIAGVNGAVAALFEPAWRPSSLRSGRTWLRSGRTWLAPAVGAALLAAAFGYGLVRERTGWTRGPEVPVALLHDPVRPGEPPAGAEPARAFARRLAWSRDAALRGARLVVWPELALPRPLGAEGLPDGLEEALAAAPSWWLLGAAVERRRLDGVDRANAMLLLRDGRVRGRHDKIELLPFAEDERARPLLGRAPRGWKPGERLRPLRTDELALGVLVCSEALRPDLARRLVEAGATVLVNASYDGWYPTEGAREQALRVVALRAIETRRWLLRSSLGGYSGAIGPRGRPRALADPDEPGGIEARIRPIDATTPYVRAGDLLPAAAVAACFAFGWLVARPRRPSEPPRLR